MQRLFFEYRFAFTRFHVFFFCGRSIFELAQRCGLSVDRWVRDGEFSACVLEKSARGIQVNFPQFELPRVS